MPTAEKVHTDVLEGRYDDQFETLYGAGEATLATQRQRYAATLASFGKHYGAGREVRLYSTPGRTEIGGNHTDHNQGVVLAGSVDLDIIAVVSRNDDEVIRVRSEGFPGEDAVALDSLKVDEAEFGRSSALIRGVAAGIRQRGGQAGGFDAYTTSNVLKGSGLSSSAAFEVCLASILNGEFNGDRFTPVELSFISQHAENVFFGKPSGLMDQLACAVGGLITIDFKDPAAPVVEKTDLDLAAKGFAMVITDTRGDHADLTPDYAAVPKEMRAVAACFGKEVLRQVDEEDFLARLPEVRAKAGDRAALRAIHFFEDSKRAMELAQCLRQDDFDGFLRLIVEGGHSSFEFNQNAYSIRHPDRQEVPLALALSQLVLAGRGAWRLQGGGFAGTIQAFVPDDLLEAYCRRMDDVFGEGASHVVSIRGVGCSQLNMV